MSGAVLEGARVLLLEDDVLINFATSDALEEMGCQVSAYTRLQDALNAIDRELPDIAILDINIDGVISYEAAERLHGKGVPIIFVTGYESPTRLGHWKSFPHCAKPCDPAKLRTLLIEALATRPKPGDPV